MFYKKTLITLAALGLILGAGVASSYAFGNMAWGPRGDFNPGERREMFNNRDAQISAMENNDYSAWLKAAQDKGIGEIIDTKEEFDKLVQAHTAMESGDYETAKTLHEELGLPGIAGGERGRGMGHMLPFNDKNGDGICDFSDFANQ